MKNRYLSPERKVQFMMRVREVAGLESGVSRRQEEAVFRAFRKLMNHKHCDALLLCILAAAFSTLLIVSVLA